MVIFLCALALIGAPLRGADTKRFILTPLTGLESPFLQIVRRIQGTWMSEKITKHNPKTRLASIAYVVKNLQIKREEMIQTLRAQAKMRSNLTLSSPPPFSEESLFVYAELLPEHTLRLRPQDSEVFGKSIVLRTPPLGTKQQFFHSAKTAPTCYHPAFQIWSAARFPLTHETIWSSEQSSPSNETLTPSEVIMLFLDAIRMLISEPDAPTRKWYGMALRHIWWEGYFPALRKHESKQEIQIPPPRDIVSRRDLNSIIKTLFDASIKYTVNFILHQGRFGAPDSTPELSLQALLHEDLPDLPASTLIRHLQSVAALLAHFISLETAHSTEGPSLWKDISDIPVLRDYTWKNPEIILEEFNQAMETLDRAISASFSEDLRAYYEKLLQKNPDKILKKIKKDQAMLDQLKRFCIKVSSPEFF